MERKRCDWNTGGFGEGRSPIRSALSRRGGTEEGRAHAAMATALSRIYLKAY